MGKDKIKVSIIIDKKALIDKAFMESETPEEFNEVRLIIDDSDEFVRDATELDDEKKRKSHNDSFSALGLDILLCKYNQTKMAQRFDAMAADEGKAKKNVLEQYEQLKKKLGEDNPIVKGLGDFIKKSRKEVSNVC